MLLIAAPFEPPTLSGRRVLGEHGEFRARTKFARQCTCDRAFSRVESQAGFRWPRAVVTRFRWMLCRSTNIPTAPRSLRRHPESGSPRRAPARML